VHFQSPWPEDCLVDQIPSIRNTDDQDVVERVDTVDTGQELVYN
jgi:hypothetical protein